MAKILTAKTDGKAAYCILAVENESKINYAMPVKNGLYDFMQLARQVTETTGSHKRTPNDSAKPSKDEFLSGFWKSVTQKCSHIVQLSASLYTDSLFWSRYVGWTIVFKADVY